METENENSKSENSVQEDAPVKNSLETSFLQLVCAQNENLVSQINELNIDPKTPVEETVEILQSREMISEIQLLKAYAAFFNFEIRESLEISKIDPKLVAGISILFCQQYTLVPIDGDEDTIVVAITNPVNWEGIEFLRTIVEKNIAVVLCQKATIDAAINSVFERFDLLDQGGSGLQAGEGGEDNIEGLEIAQDLLQNLDEAPVRKEVSTIIRRGITEKASDIHMEPYEDRISVRFRLDGRLREVRVIPKKYQSSVITRIKILSKLNIAESRLPQDGRITLRVGQREVDIRVSTLPVKFGERIVLRILADKGGIPKLEESGMPADVLEKFKTLIQQKHGIILVTGPTGSGKTTALASSLMYINKPDVSIITVEDPVEVQLPGTSQVEVNEKAGLTFAAALRSILRQNPNIILIGEIRDTETAKIATQAAITGHLVLSTLHTNDSASSVTRLVDFGIETFQISTAVLGILAMRLIRRVCPNCREEYKYPEESLESFGLTSKEVGKKKLYRVSPNGCDNCKQTGYSGRIGIYELLIFDEQVRNFILTSSDGSALKKFCMDRGMKTLLDSARERFLNGETTLDEVIYATNAEQH